MITSCTNESQGLLTDNLSNKNEYLQEMTNYSSDGINYIWYLNGVQVQPETYNPLDSNLYVSTVVDETNQNLYRVHAYSSKDDYIHFGDLNGLDIRGILEFNDLIEIERSKGTLTESKAEEIYNEINRRKISQRNFFLIGHDFCDGNGDGSNPIVSIFRLMPTYGSFRNRTTAISGPTSIYFGLSCYDRIWWKRNIGSFWTWGGPGWQGSLPWWLDNKIDSSITWL